jgi:hypothetical protein
MTLVPPAPISGLALGLTGLASIALELQNQNTSTNLVLKGLALAFDASAFLVAAAVVIPRACTGVGRRMAAGELQTPPALATYGALQMAFLFLASRQLPKAAAVPALYGGAAAQMILMLHFLKRCYATGTKPEPFFNPITCNIAATTICGCILGLDIAEHPVVLASFTISTAIEIVLVPAELYRLLTDAATAPDISVNILQAPCSLNGIAYFNLVRSNARNLPAAFSAPSTAAVFFAKSSMLFFFTLYCICARRKSLYNEGWGVGFTALTFPTSATALVALQYAYDEEAAGFLRGYALIVAVVTAVVILYVTARLFYAGLGAAACEGKEEGESFGHDNSLTEEISETKYATSGTV